MPFCTRAPMGSPPATIDDLRARTQAFVREVLPDLDDDPVAFEATVDAIVEQFEFIISFKHVV